MKHFFLFIILLVVLVCGCSEETVTDNETEVPKEPEVANLYFPPSNSGEWATSSLEALDWKAEAEQALKDFLQEKNTKAFIVLKGGKIALEWYFGDHTQNTSWYWASAGKTLSAFTVGLAQEEALLDINNKTSDYLGSGWTNMETQKEDLITLWHQLTMTGGMNAAFFDCVTSDCLQYVGDAGSRWAYHNGPYTLLQKVVANASQKDWSDYFNTNLRNKIGMDGFWLSTNDLNNVYFSTARSMARFGLLNLNNGIWNKEVILGDEDYLNQMISTSQNFNQSYGYLLWLNGKSSYLAPGLPTEFNGPLIPDAPSDTYAGLGKNDQKLYIVPSEGLVIVRLGEDTGENLLGPSSFDNALWKKLNDLIN